MKIILREKGKNPSLFISIISVNEVFLLFQFLYKILYYTSDITDRQR